MRPAVYGVKPAKKGVKKPGKKMTGRIKEKKRVMRKGGSISYSSGSVKSYSKKYPGMGG